MLEEDQLVLDLLHDAIFSGGGWFRANCPFCPEILGKDDKKKSFGIHIDGGYHCFRCYVSGHLMEMPDWVGLGLGDKLRQAQEEDDDVIDFFREAEEFVPLWRDPGDTAVVFEPARRYLIDERGIGPDIWEAAHVGAAHKGKYGGRIIVPIYNEEGDNWVGFSSRVWKKKAPMAHRYPPKMSREIFYEQHLLREETDQPVLIVEGVLDALPYFGSAIACLGKPTLWHIKQLSKVKSRPMVLCLDGDAWREAHLLVVRLRYFGCQAGFVRLPPGKDPNRLAVERGADWLLDEARKAV